MIEIQREPSHPGAILKEDFLKPLKITQSYLAKELSTSLSAINEIVNEKRGITIDMSIRLSKYFRTTPELWLNLQNQYDLYRARKNKKDIFNEVNTCSLIGA